jgi:hypothetical protein
MAWPARANRSFTASRTPRSGPAAATGPGSRRNGPATRQTRAGSVIVGITGAVALTCATAIRQPSGPCTQIWDCTPHEPSGRVDSATTATEPPPSGRRCSRSTRRGPGGGRNRRNREMCSAPTSVVPPSERSVSAPARNHCSSAGTSLVRNARS